jgi:hypothetical protein
MEVTGMKKVLAIAVLFVMVFNVVIAYGENDKSWDWNAYDYSDAERYFEKYGCEEWGRFVVETYGAEGFEDEKVYVVFILSNYEDDRGVIACGYAFDELGICIDQIKGSIASNNVDKTSLNNTIANFIITAIKDGSCESVILIDKR